MTKQEILNYIFKSKDGASWNEVSEMLNEYEKENVSQFMTWLYDVWHRKRYATPQMLVKMYFEHVYNNRVEIDGSWCKCEDPKVMLDDSDNFRRYCFKCNLDINPNGFEKTEAGGQKTLKTVEQHEPGLNEPEQACFISHVSNPVCPSCGTDDIIYRFKTNSFICHKCVDIEWANGC